MKRIIAAVLLALMLLCMTGCSSLFSKEYYEVTDYTDDSTDNSEETEGAIKNYKALFRAMRQMLARHETSGRFVIVDYDGNIGEDLANACWEIKNSIALGSFAIEYISYDLNRIVSYYEADIYMTYRRTGSQVDSIVNLSMASALRSQLANAMEAGSTYLVCSINTMSIGADTIRQYVQEIYNEGRPEIICLPKAGVSIYSGSGSAKIFEITLDYGFEPEELEQMKAELAEKVDAFEQSIPANDDQSQWLSLTCGMVSDSITYDPDSAARIETMGDDSGMGATAYGAFVERLADSRGLAMAVRLLCQDRGIECTTVSGRLENVQHWWNIVTIDGKSFHVDASMWRELAYLCLDGDMVARGYSWDSDAYPVCSVGNADNAKTEETLPQATDET